MLLFNNICAHRPRRCSLAYKSRDIICASASYSVEYRYLSFLALTPHAPEQGHLLHKYSHHREMTDMAHRAFETLRFYAFSTRNALILWRTWPLLGNGSVNRFPSLRSEQNKDARKPEQWNQNRCPLLDSGLLCNALVATELTHVYTTTNRSGTVHC
jgi:hypothetical protein